MSAAELNTKLDGLKKDLFMPAHAARDAISWITP